MSVTVSTASLSDSLPSSVPKLDASGLNWAIFLVRFQDTVEAKGFWGHFDGTNPVPALSSPAKSDELVAKAQWDKDERSAKSLLTQRLPDSTLMKIHTKKSVQERWEAVVKEFTEKGAYAQTELRAKFLASRCAEKRNVRAFLDELRVRKEELVQVGVVIDNKDYLSTIISSLPVALSNFASAQLAAARMFASTKSIEPEVLMSLLAEEADRQKAQQVRRRVSEKEGEDDDEALVAGADSSRFRRGKARANVECWGCGEKGHFKWQCKNPKVDEKSKEDEKEVAGTVESDSEGEGAWAVEDDEVSIVSRGASLVSPVFDDEDEMALVFEEVDDTEEPDWFERVTCGDEESAVTELYKTDWFDEVAEGEEESDDEVASSEDVSVDVFGRDALEGTNPKDSGIIGQIGLIYDNIFEGADRLSSTLLGPCQDEAPVAPADYPEGEYRGGGSTCESSGWMPDLDVLENPWIDNATMEWRNHAIVLQTVEVEAESRPLGDHKGGDDPTARTCEGCTKIESRPLGNHKGGEAENDPAARMREEYFAEEKGPGVPEIERDAYEEYSLVPRFEGEEENTSETMDLPVKSPVPPKVVPYMIFSSAELPEVEPGGVGWRNLMLVVIFVRGNAIRAPIFVDFRFGQLAIAGNCNEGQKGIQDMFGMGGLTLDVTAHLERPPSGDFELEESQLCWKMNANYFWSSLISFLDACRLLITWHVYRAIFGMPILPKIMRSRSCVGLKGSVGYIGTNTTRDAPWRRGNILCGFSYLFCL